MFRVAARNWAGAHLADIAALALLGALSVVALLTFRHYGLGWDDYTHAEYGELLLAYYTSGFEDTRALSFVNLYYYGGGFDMLSAIVARILPLDLFAARRLMGAVVGLIGLVITWRLGRRLGGPNAGLAALVLLTLCPLYYGHMFMNAKDVPFAVAKISLLYALVRAFEEYPKPSWKTVALFGLTLGLTLGTRVMGGIAVLSVGLAGIVLLTLEARRIGLKSAIGRFGAFAGILCCGLVLAYGVMGLVWPWSIAEPLNPVRAVMYFTKFWEVPWRELYEGSAVLVPEMPRGYVPTLFAVTMPEVFLLLALLGIGVALRTLFRADAPPIRRTIEILLLGAALVPILVTVATKPAMYNGIRHFVFVTPPLAVLGGLAVAWLIERLAPLPRLRAATFGALGLAASVTVVDMVRLHPYQYAHYNHLIGGLQTADREFMLDYWGLAFKQAGEELRAEIDRRGLKPPVGRRWKVATCGPHNAARIALGPNFVVTYDTHGADFALMLGEYYCQRLPLKPMVEVSREGVMFAAVYDVRSADPLASVFSTPPIQPPLPNQQQASGRAAMPRPAAP
ncbi:glycosyltransferase family 39 protein [Blastochloris sulfoviridis]|uniref:glycosyltransferase family 39 protein n=1 Tax=Blastochloris sulfoviridis TaxID=50712 RepID=UPI001FE30525|nr:glycosyltransferase family 39 protein [Blastochloris sulfoviridis]